MSRSVLMSLVACAVLAAPIAWGQAGQAKSETQKTYVGSEKCQSCHEKEYDRFRKYSRKTQSFNHIALMKKDSLKKSIVIAWNAIPPDSANREDLVQRGRRPC